MYPSFWSCIRETFAHLCWKAIITFCQKHRYMNRSQEKMAAIFVLWRRLMVIIFSRIPFYSFSRFCMYFAPFNPSFQSWMIVNKIDYVLQVFSDSSLCCNMQGLWYPSTSSEYKISTPFFLQRKHLTARQNSKYSIAIQNNSF